MNEIYPTYLDLVDVILDLFDGVAIDVVANVNLLASNHLRPDNCKEEEKKKQPALTLNVFEEKLFLSQTLLSC